VGQTFERAGRRRKPIVCHTGLLKFANSRSTNNDVLCEFHATTKSDLHLLRLSCGEAPEWVYGIEHR
jgi:hypothetical protein